MRYASVCDGIGAVHVAWQPLGWECAWTSEIEPFPAAVVDHHWGVRNVGDMTEITEELLNECGPVSLLVGGTPCQSFSVAGLRRGLDDPRGNLALRFVQLVGVMRPTWVVWENVPGVLSSAGGRDFGTFLGALAKLGYGFAYRILDAQWFGVAQRRRRVFVVAHARDWRRAAAVLFERESLRGDPPTRGASRKDVAGALVARAARNGGAANAAVDAGQLIFGGNNTAGPIDVEPAVLAHGSPNGRQDFASEAFVVSDDPAHAICANEQKTYTNEGSVFQLRNVVGHPVAYGLRNDAGRSGEAKTPSPDAKGRVRLRDAGFNVLEDVAPTLDATQPHSVFAESMPVAFSATDSGGDAATDITPTVRAMGHNGSRANVVGHPQPFVKAKRAQSATDDESWVAGSVAPTKNTFDQGDTRSTTVVVAHGDTVGTLRGNYRNNSDPITEAAMHVMHGIAVRRLTPLECERLQGFPDGYTDVKYRGRQASDGPRYKSIGNSMAVPVMAWIGKRIAAVEAMK